MVGTDVITAIVQREVAEYAAESPNSKAYFVENPAEQVYAVLVVPDQTPQKSTIMVMARVTEDQIIILTDKTDRPLSDALVQAGIPQSQIIPAYLEAITLN